MANGLGACRLVHLVTDPYLQIPALTKRHEWHPAVGAGLFAHVTIRFTSYGIIIFVKIKIHYMENVLQLD